MVNLLLEMTEPIHHTGKIVTGNSGFCVVDGVIALHKKGVHGQFLIKKQKYWPKYVPSNHIDEYMSSKPLGYTKTFVQVIDGMHFFIHCTQENDYVTKIMSMHGILDKIQDHPTWQLVNGVGKSFKYTEPLSHHNHAKHWVDDINNRSHDPIGLESAWATKWWPNRGFKFILSVVEANAVQAWAHAKKEAAVPTLEFWKNVAMKMMTNKLGNNGVAAASPKCTWASLSNNHVLKKRLKKQGIWNYTKQKFVERNTLYIPHLCFDCRMLTRDYCSCDPGCPLCAVCYGKHLKEHGC